MSGETKPRFFGNHVLGDGVSGVYLGDSVDEMLAAVRNSLEGGITPEELHDLGEPIVIRVCLMTDAEVAALPDI